MAIYFQLSLKDLRRINQEQARHLSLKPSPPPRSAPLFSNPAWRGYSDGQTILDLPKADQAHA